MAENPEYEDLDQLVQSAGWARFTKMVTDQWGPSSEWFLGQLDTALGDDSPRGTDHFRQIRASQREVLKVLQLVPQRLKVLRPPKADAEPTGSRRGAL